MKKKPCCLGCIGDYTIQLYGDFKGPISTFQILRDAVHIQAIVEND